MESKKPLAECDHCGGRTVTHSCRDCACGQNHLQYRKCKKCGKVSKRTIPIDQVVRRKPDKTIPVA